MNSIQFSQSNGRFIHEFFANRKHASSFIMMLHAHHEDIVKLNERFIWLRNHREDDDDQNDRQQSFERQIKFVAFLLIDQPMDGWNKR